MRALPHPATDDIELTEVLRALSDPVRLEAVARLAAEGEMTCGDVGRNLGVHKSTASHHFRALREVERGHDQAGRQAEAHEPAPRRPRRPLPRPARLGALRRPCHRLTRCRFGVCCRTCSPRWTRTAVPC
ncbi:ArsR/SmtB family transcription factor [Nonomuraea ferruginea]